MRRTFSFSYTKAMLARYIFNTMALVKNVAAFTMLVVSTLEGDARGRTDDRVRGARLLGYRV